MCPKKIVKKVIGKPKMPPLPAPPPVKAEAADPTKRVNLSSSRNRERRRAGRSGTIVTGPRGLGDAAPVQRKTLLGQ